MRPITSLTLLFSLCTASVGGCSCAPANPLDGGVLGIDPGQRDGGRTSEADEDRGLSRRDSGSPFASGDGGQLADAGGTEDAGGGNADSVIGPELLPVPAGDFEMGCDNCQPDEAPRHTVMLSAFSIHATEISQAHYASCVDAGLCTSTTSSTYSPLTTPHRPVTGISWAQAQSYCAALGLTLPTEAQWEKACRGSAGGIYPWGDADPTCALANTSGCGPDETNEEVDVDNNGTAQSPFGALHMAGNVWEWTADWYSAAHYNDHPDEDPQGPEAGTVRTYRGGSSGNDASLARCSNRADTYSSDVGGSGLGFRCVTQ